MCFAVKVNSKTQTTWKVQQTFVDFDVYSLLNRVQIICCCNLNNVTKRQRPRVNSNRLFVTVLIQIFKDNHKMFINYATIIKSTHSGDSDKSQLGFLLAIKFATTGV